MPTPIPPPDSHYITRKQFDDMRALYTANREVILDPAYRGKDVLALSELFNVIPVNVLTNWTGCAGMRIYYGMKPDNTVHAMLVAVDINGDDILPPIGSAKFTAGLLTDPPVVEDSHRCPPNC